MAYDIFFLSFGEPNAESNWEKLRIRFPHAKRVRDIKGILPAHQECARKSLTSHFFVIDADTELLPNFNPNFRVGLYDAEYVHLWYARNPINALEYGWGGVKLFSKRKLLGTSAMTLDMTTEFPLKIMEEVVSITHFNASAMSAWRSGFREAYKLSVMAETATDPRQALDAMERLDVWTTRGLDRPNGYWAVKGANDGKHLFNNDGTLEPYYIEGQTAKHAFINDWNKLNNHFDKKYANIATVYDNQSELFMEDRIKYQIYPPTINQSIDDWRNFLTDLIAKHPDIDWMSDLSEYRQHSIWASTQYIGIDGIEYVHQDASKKTANVYLLGDPLFLSPAWETWTDLWVDYTFHVFTDKTRRPVADAFRKAFFPDKYKVRYVDNGGPPLNFMADLLPGVDGLTIDASPDAVLHYQAHDIPNIEEWLARLPKGLYVGLMFSTPLGMEDTFVDPTITLREFIRKHDLRASRITDERFAFSYIQGVI